MFEHFGGGLVTALGGRLLRRLVAFEQRKRLVGLGVFFGRRRRLLRLRPRRGFGRRGSAWPTASAPSSSSSSSLSQSLTSTSSPAAVSTVRATASRTLCTLGFLFPLTLTVNWTSNSSGPTCTRSPPFNSCSAVRRSPLRKVPLLLPKSRTAAKPSPRRIMQCRRLTRLLCGRNWHPSVRPITNSGPGTGMIFPGCFPLMTIRFTSMAAPASYDGILCAKMSQTCRLGQAERRPTNTSRRWDSYLVPPYFLRITT